VQLSIDGRADLDSPHPVVADVRDRDRICRLFAEHRPRVVVHAAALKDVPLLEQHVGEAVKTMITGTQWMLHAALTSGVERFVTISTDQAAEPINALGFTKRIAERLTAAAGLGGRAPDVSVRFGNSLYCRGSVLETFHAPIASGGPVTVTAAAAAVTRYFMTVGEAVQLTIQAGALGRTGDNGGLRQVGRRADRPLHPGTALPGGGRAHRDRPSALHTVARKEPSCVSPAGVLPIWFGIGRAGSADPWDAYLRLHQFRHPFAHP